jgi:hypothetical protein
MGLFVSIEVDIGRNDLIVVLGPRRCLKMCISETIAVSPGSGDIVEVS